MLCDSLTGLGPRVGTVSSVCVLGGGGRAAEKWGGVSLVSGTSVDCTMNSHSLIGTHS